MALWVKISRPITYEEACKRLDEIYSKDTDYRVSEHIDGKIVARFFDKNEKKHHHIFRAEVTKRLSETFSKDTDWTAYHQYMNDTGRQQMSVHFYTENWLRENPDKDGRKKQVISYEWIEPTLGGE